MTEHEERALREELEGLAADLRVRRSIQEGARALFATGALLLSVGVGVAALNDLGWPRWLGVALGGVSVALLAIAVRAVLAARRLRVEETTRFARMVDVRRALGLPAVSWGTNERRAA